MCTTQSPLCCSDLPIAAITIFSHSNSFFNSSVYSRHLLTLVSSQTFQTYIAKSDFLRMVRAVLMATETITPHTHFVFFTMSEHKMWNKMWNFGICVSVNELSDCGCSRFTFQYFCFSSTCKSCVQRPALAAKLAFLERSSIKATCLQRPLPQGWLLQIR